MQVPAPMKLNWFFSISNHCSVNNAFVHVSSCFKAAHASVKTCDVTPVYDVMTRRDASNRTCDSMLQQQIKDVFSNCAYIFKT